VVETTLDIELETLASGACSNDVISTIRKIERIMELSKHALSRKLVVAGPRDSGKTLWENIFHRIIPLEYINSITNKRPFSAFMITDDTQLIIIDKWCGTRMNSELAKTILQGGWMVTAVKHGQPRCVNSFSPFYITTNTVPDFGAEDDNVQLRIQIFETSSLPATMFGIDKWLFDNSMHCIAWIADQINRNRSRRAVVQRL
jgi:hypothetical protein